MTVVGAFTRPLVGRRAELAELRRRLPTERLITLTGAPGCGTSTLAVAAVTDFARAHPGPVHTILVEDVPDAAALAATLADAFDLPLADIDSPPADVAAQLGDRAGLLLLDGCERLVEPCAALVASLLKEVPQSRVLVTSRQVLGVPGEAVCSVGPLDLPADTTPTAEQAAASDAVALFVDRATEARRTFRLTDANAPAVAAICTQLEGNALAVVLAAARMSVLSPEDLLHRLEDVFHLLTKAPPDVAPRHRSLLASVQATHDLCTGEEQTLWSRLAVFAGSVDLEAAEQVCGGEGIDEMDVLDLVDGLLEKGVLTRDESEPAQVRYRMSDALRTFPGARLEEPEVQRLRDRHLAWCRAMVAEAHDAWFGGQQQAISRRLRVERANLRLALRYADGEPTRAVEAAELAAGLAPLWLVSGDLAEGRSWLDRALARDLPPDVRLRAVLIATWLAVLDGEAAQGRLRLAESRAMAPGPDRDSAAVLRLDGSLAALEGRFTEAEALLRRAIESAVKDDDTPAAATGWYLLGSCLWMAGQAAAAAAAAEQVQALTTAAGETHLRASALSLLAMAALDGGDPEKAEGLARETLRLHVALGDQGSVTAAVELLAWVAVARSDHERAAALLGVLRARLHLHRPPLEVPAVRDGAERRARAEEATAQALGRRRFDVRSREGEALPDDAALQFALEDVLVQRRAPDEAEQLTPRELGVAELVGRGLSNRDIGTDLGISERTAQGHVQNILRKLGFTSRTQVAAWVAERNARASG